MAVNESPWPLLLPVLTGLLGGLIGMVTGAVLNAWLTTRRERWNLKRDLYTRLLEHLGEAKHALDGLFETETTMRPVGPNPVSEEWWKARRRTLMSKASKAADKIRRATSVAAILLNAEAIEALKKLEAEWAKADAEPDPFDVFDQRLASVQRAYELVLAAARADLRIGA